ncbi:endonuclease domain-containing protein [Saccharicrinis sp. FJH2]|uniref:endonuclease domain-containing protein n=1 Tax=Saccharicrinis sp. FJH65 TaxID=3344659 RepID=UPI0035F291F8
MIPINFEKIKREKNPYQSKDVFEVVDFLVTITEKGQKWDKSYIADIEELKRLRDELNEILDSLNTSEVLSIYAERAKKIDDHNQNDGICSDCEMKQSKDCIKCLFELQSPLERKLFKELKRNRIYFQVQYALDWNGNSIDVSNKSYSDPINNFKNVLTVADFYITKRGEKLCVYTDGHTYHERTEEQAQRDRNIDRKLQELGYRVLRYTGKEVNDKMEQIITEIKKWTDFN